MKNKISLLLVMFAFTLSGFSQSLINDFKIEFKINEASGSQPDVLFNIEVSDTVGVSEVVISLGSTLGGSEHLSQSLKLNGSNLPAEYTLSYQTNKLIINTSSRSGVATYYASAKLKYTNGSYSESILVSNVE